MPGRCLPNNQPMEEHQQIYQQGADQYQRLISREDYQGKLLPALQRIKHPDGLDIIDLGAGTGRLACLLAPSAGSVYAFDASLPMLAIANQRLKTFDHLRWLTAAADHRRIPLPAGSADLVVSGWSMCYLVVWEGQAWQESLQLGLREIRRLLRSGGKLIIVETLGTGEREPKIPQKLADYFQYLETAGFHSTWIRTDYRFRSRPEARELVEFFFGQEMLPKIGPGSTPVLPECTGIWWT
ncbi:MAG: class I SAM-dependent methyltransferase [Anaerolineales bacterium]